MKAKYILIFGSLVTIFLIVLWQFQIVGEPIAALSGGVLTFVGYLLANKSSRTGSRVNDSSPNKIIQKHSGKGDNVGGDKTINM